MMHAIFRLKALAGLIEKNNVRRWGLKSNKFRMNFLKDEYRLDSMQKVILSLCRLKTSVHFH